MKYNTLDGEKGIFINLRDIGFSLKKPPLQITLFCWKKKPTLGLFVKGEKSHYSNKYLNHHWYKKNKSNKEELTKRFKVTQKENTMIQESIQVKFSNHPY